MEWEFKTWPDPFRGIKEGKKPCEVRSWDREGEPKIGDTLYLREWAPNPSGIGGKYTGDSIRGLEISYIIHVGDWSENGDGILVLCWEPKEEYKTFPKGDLPKGFYWLLDKTGSEEVFYFNGKEWSCQYFNKPLIYWTPKEIECDYLMYCPIKNPKR